MAENNAEKCAMHIELDTLNKKIEEVAIRASGEAVRMETLLSRMGNLGVVKGVRSLQEEYGQYNGLLRLAICLSDPDMTVDQLFNDISKAKFAKEYDYASEDSRVRSLTTD